MCRYRRDVIAIIAVLINNELNVHERMCCYCWYARMFDYFHYINTFFFGYAPMLHV
jgi:hypothetical protein